MLFIRSLLSDLIICINELVIADSKLLTYLCWKHWLTLIHHNNIWKPRIELTPLSDISEFEGHLVSRLLLKVWWGAAVLQYWIDRLNVIRQLSHPAPTQSLTTKLMLWLIPTQRRQSDISHFYKEKKNSRSTGLSCTFLAWIHNE